MRYAHPNPLRSDKESRQRHGAQDLSDLVAQALAKGEATITPVTATDVEEAAERNKAALRKKCRRAGRRGAEVRAAQQREAARRKEAARS